MCMFYCQSDTIWEGQYLFAKFTSIEKFWGKLKKLCIHITEDLQIIVFQHLLKISRPQVIVEIPCRNRIDLILSIFFKCIFKPYSVIENFQPLWTLMKGCFGENWARQYRPITYVIYFFHMRNLYPNIFILLELWVKVITEIVPKVNMLT